MKRVNVEVIEKPTKLRYFLDTEFWDKEIVDFQVELISIAMISEDNQEFYGVSQDFDPTSCDDYWLNQHVIAKLPPREEWISMLDIQKGLLDLIGSADHVEFWARNGFYDHFILCKLFGGLGMLKNRLKEEKGVQKLIFRDTHELRRMFGESGLPELPEEEMHSAINDVRHEKAEFDVWMQDETRKNALV